MDIFKAQLARLQQQLSGLTASQKMLAAALVAIMAMTLVWWGRYAGQADLSPLLDQSFSSDDMAQITSRLSAKGIQYTVSGDRILVPSDRKIEILSDLGFAHLLPQKINTAFDEIVKQMTPWDTSDKDQHLWVEAKQRTLEAVIGSFPHVREATVVIDPTSERRLDGPDVTATAAVYLTTGNDDGEQMNVRALATAAADLVAGAEAGLSRGKVTVVVDGTTIPVPDRGEGSGMADGDTIVQAIRENEGMYTDKIKQALGWINGLFVSVRVDLKTARTETAETTYDPKAVAHSSVSEEESSNEATGGSGGAEPGVTANITANSAPTSTSGGGGNSTDTESKQTYANAFSHKDVKTIQPPGEAPPVSASVRVPRSYFLAMYKDKNKGADPTNDAALDAVAQTELKQIRQDVMACTGIKDEAAVSTSMYDDEAVAATNAIPAAASGSSQVTRLLEGHVKDIGVGALAMVSLFMVMMMVRKSSGPALALATGAGAEAGDPNEPANRLQSGPMVAGEASEGNNTMDGMELDEEALKTQQVVQQVSAMVSQNPDAAANLVKRWLNRS